jgi:hypothetical protein
MVRNRREDRLQPVVASTDWILCEQFITVHASFRGKIVTKIEPLPLDSGRDPARVPEDN